MMKRVLGALVALLVGVTPAFAADMQGINGADTAFVMICAALVMLMTPAVAFFYGGMVRTKNVLNTIMQCVFVMGLVTLSWVVIGYSLAFGTDHAGLIGGFDFVGLKGVGLAPVAGSTIPHMLFMIFQCMFIVLTCALVSGSFAERMRFSAFSLFILIWSIVVYPAVAHWAWGSGGWMASIGVLDFAGGTVVHILSGVTGLVLALMVGKRQDYGRVPMPPHHLPMTMLGAALLWFGWFGFNAGSALAANEIAVNAFAVSHIAAGAAVVVWVCAEWIVKGKPSLLGAACGCIAGLVAITPAAGFVGVIPAIIIGGVGGFLCFWGVTFLKTRLGYDDSLDAFGVHGIGGTWGALSTGLFASTGVNPAGADGLFYGNPSLLLSQATGVVGTIIFAAVMSYIIAKVVSIFVPLRVPVDVEGSGLDENVHGERAYGEKLPFSGN